MTVTLPPPPEPVVIERFEIEQQNTATTIPAFQTDVTSPSSLAVIAGPRDERLLEDEYRVLHIVDAYFSEDRDRDISIASLRDFLASTLTHESADDSGSDVLVVNRKRKVLFSDTVDVSNLPKRRPSVVLLGIDESDE